MIYVRTKRRGAQRQKRGPWEDTGKDWVYVAASQGTPWGHHKLERQARIHLWSLQRECDGPTDTLILDSGFQKCERKISIVLCHVVYGNMFQQPQETNASPFPGSSCVISLWLRQGGLSWYPCFGAPVLGSLLYLTSIQALPRGVKGCAHLKPTLYPSKQYFR